MSFDVAIKVEHISKRYQMYERPQDRLKQSIYLRLNRILGRAPKQYFKEFVALNDVSFEVKKGEFFGIIGRNGSGKSTLLKILAGIYQTDSGSISIDGRISPFLELGIGFNPELSGRDNVYLNATVLGLTKKEIDEKFDSIVAFSELERFID